MARRRRKGGWKRNAKKLLPSTIPKAIAAGSYVYNMWLAPDGSGNNPMNRLFTGDWNTGIRHTLERHTNFENWALPAGAAAAGWVLRKAAGPGPTIIGNFRAW